MDIYKETIRKSSIKLTKFKIIKFFDFTERAANQN